jgi:molybdopterin-guanine dinucleotide biosynthesis protein B
MPPILSIVGRAKSGKTTLLVSLISVLQSRGYRIATVKHVSHGLSFDTPGTDSWQHIQAGSVATAIIAPDQFVFIKPTDVETSLDKAVSFFGSDYDLLLIEGLKRSATPKIEVHRKEKGPLLTGIQDIIAIATDEKIDIPTRQFSLTDIPGIACFIETTMFDSKKL